MLPTNLRLCEAVSGLTFDALIQKEAADGSTPVAARRGRSRRHELTDEEWAIIQPLLPNKPRGVPRVDDRRALNLHHVLGH